jgi:hypothetical protein
VAVSVTGADAGAGAFTPADQRIQDVTQTHTHGHTHANAGSENQKSAAMPFGPASIAIQQLLCGGPASRGSVS